MVTSEGIRSFHRGRSGLSADRSSPTSGPSVDMRCFTASKLGLAGTGPAATETTARKPISVWRVFLDDDGSNQLHGAVWPLTREELEFRTDILVDDGIDAFAWCTFLPDLCHYDTKVGECLTSPQRLTTSDSPRRWSAADNLRRLIESGDEPLKVLVERCHIPGIAFAATIRMNDAHGGSYEFAHVSSKFFLEHREWLIRDERGTPTVGMDYPIPEVRAHLSAILREQAENYEIEGLEVDFMRWPPFSQPQRWLRREATLSMHRAEDSSERGPWVRPSAGYPRWHAVSERSLFCGESPLRT